MADALSAGDGALAPRSSLHACWRWQCTCCCIRPADVCRSRSK